jgi:PAS domain S-box-containing protein
MLDIKENKLKSLDDVSQFKLDLGNSENVLYRFDHGSSKYEYMSEGIVSLTGFTIDEINEMGFSYLIIDKIVHNFNRVELYEQKNKVEDIEDAFARYLIRTKDGKEKWIEDNSLITISKEGQKLKSVGVLKDLSAFHSYLEDLKDEKNKIDTILDIVDVILIMIDKEENVKMINKKGIELLGYDREEIIKKNWFDNFIPKSDREKARKLFISLKNNQSGTYYIEYSIETKSGSLKNIKWTNTSILDERGNFLYTISSGLDITEIKRWEKVQQIIYQIIDNANSEININELYKFIHRSIQRLMPAENFYISLYDKQKDLLTFPYFVDQYDEYIFSQKFGKGLTEYVIQTGKPMLVNKAMDEELMKKGETELIGPQSSIWLGVPLKIMDTTIGAIVVQDYHNESTYGDLEKEILEVVSFPISRAIERKRVQQEKNELLEKLKVLNDSKDKLFSLISHDLRSPFNSLLGFSEILTTEYNSLSDEEIKEYLNVIYDASKNLYGMTNNLLQYSRFQMKRFEFNPVKINLKKIIDDSITLLRGNAIKKNILLASEHNSNISVTADEDMLNSIVQNLISNAIKFTRRGGEVKILSNIIKFFDQPSQVELKFQDSGIGISKNDLNKIMNNFMFSTRGTDREYGTGLGLLLVREFVEKNEGQFKIESKPGHGTTVIIRFPISE